MKGKINFQSHEKKNHQYPTPKKISNKLNTSLHVVVVHWDNLRR